MLGLHFGQKPFPEFLEVTMEVYSVYELSKMLPMAGKLKGAKIVRKWLVPNGW
jgi:hypothetical protein